MIENSGEQMQRTHITAVQIKRALDLICSFRGRHLLLLQLKQKVLKAQLQTKEKIANMHNTVAPIPNAKH